jgi:hypothetical protein
MKTDSLAVSDAAPYPDILLAKKTQLFEEPSCSGKSYGPVMSNWSTGSRIQEFDLRRPEAYPRGLQVGLILHALYFQPIQVHRGDVPELGAIAAHFEYLVIIRQILLANAMIAFC